MYKYLIAAYIKYITNAFFFTSVSTTMKGGYTSFLSPKKKKSVL